MPNRPGRAFGRLAVWLLAAVTLAQVATPPVARAGESRRTAIVEAVESARSAIVNIHGEKTVDADPRNVDAKRRVNGMGTGILIDERGYIITNHHVVDGVRKIVVTTADKETYTAELLSHDPKTDLAVIKINADHEFDIIRMGISTDLMPGETVIAVGNAFGYEHTVTRGIISALHRTVQVSDTQFYEDLIQTDASINPGNSGGPLLNIDGQMIGINVAVRAGAQGIGFAIPVDTVLNVATDLISLRRLENKSHGLNSQHLVAHQSEGVLVKSIERDGPAATSGLQNGDVIVAIAQKHVARPLDIERYLLGRRNEPVEVTVQRNQQPMTVKLALAKLSDVETDEKQHDSVWEVLGLRLDLAPTNRFQNPRSPYRGGMVIVDVRNDSPAAKQGMRRGDILVGMHVWETVSLENVQYVLTHHDFAHEPVKFYILRGAETRYGYLTLAQRTAR